MGASSIHSLAVRGLKHSSFLPGLSRVSAWLLFPGAELDSPCGTHIQQVMVQVTLLCFDLALWMRIKLLCCHHCLHFLLQRNVSQADTLVCPCGYRQVRKTPSLVPSARGGNMRFLIWSSHCTGDTTHCTVCVLGWEEGGAPVQRIDTNLGRGRKSKHRKHCGTYLRLFPHWVLEELHLAVFAVPGTSRNEVLLSCAHLLCARLSLPWPHVQIKACLQVVIEPKKASHLPGNCLQLFVCPL